MSLTASGRLGFFDRWQPRWTYEFKDRRTALVTKNDMVIKIAQDTNIEQQKVKEIVQKTLDGIIEILATSEQHRYELRNFGVFEVRTRKARKARNPRTGAEVMG